MSSYKTEQEEFFGDYALNELCFKPHFVLKWPHMEILEDVFKIAMDPLDDKTNNYCDHVHSTVTVRSDSNVVRYCFDLTNQMVMDNILQGDFLEIWNNNRYLALRPSIYEKKFNSFCSSCFVVQPHPYLMIKPKVLKKLDSHQHDGLEH